MKRPSLKIAVLILVPILLAAAAAAVPPGRAASPVRFAVSIDPSVRAEPASGRILLLVSRTERFAPGVNGTPVFGRNVEALKPGESAVVDDSAFGYPDLPDGDYFVQAWLNVYTTFHRSDGKTVELHMDQGEGQNWRRSPGNLFSDPVKVRIGGEPPASIVLNRIVPPLAAAPDTPHLKHLRIQSELLTRFWGRPMFLGANILLPKGYDEHPDQRPR